jgi:cysteine desulfurase
VTPLTSHYLDHNATTPVRPEAAAAVAEALAVTGNASSVHRAGRTARRVIEAARGNVAALVGAASAEVVFTSGGTEANHLALLGCGRPRVLVSAVEHDSVLRAAPEAEAIPVDGNGIIDLGALERMLAGDPRPAIVAVMLANNETGVLQPVAEAAEIAHRHGALLHCDAVQAAGKVTVDFGRLGVDFLALSAHKLGGPQGVGALVAADRAPLEAIQRGGGHERGRRAGTENLPGIAGFGAAAEAARDGLSAAGRLAALRDQAEREILSAAADAVVIGRDAPRLPNTTCLAMPDIPAETQVMALDLAGVMVSAGSACSSGKVRVSHVLRAMALGDEIAGCAIRMSLGWSSTAADVEAFVGAWLDFHARARARRSAA